MQIEKIASALRGQRAGAGFICHCPLPSHGKGKGDRNPSLSISEGDDGRLLVKCHAGCDARDILAELRRRNLIEGPEDQQGSPPARESRKPEPIHPNPEALALWRSGLRAPDSIVEHYLLARGITQEAPPSLRFLPDYQHIPGRVILPAMMAGLQAGDGRVIAVQITMIDPRGDRKAQVRFPRKTLGRMRDGAVRLGPAGDALGLAEGVETGLSAMKLFGVSTWCCLGAGRMQSVAIPDQVHELHLFADADEAGEAAVAKTTEAHRHRRVIIHTPLPPDLDFNDALRRLDAECAA